MTAEELYTQAVELIESKSIKAWASTEHNRPILIKIANGILEKKSPEANPTSFSTWMVMEAMGM